MAVTMLGGLPEIQFGETVTDLGIVGDIAAVVFVVWFTNAFNFMDGIDGIAASEAAFIALGALALAGMGSVVGLPLGVLAAATLGFLVWNWPPAKIFMGDVGSAFLGFTLIAIAIHASADGRMSIWPWMILAGVLVVDATVTLITRALSGQIWYSAHKNHAYQKASRRLQGHRPVTLAVVSINLLWLLPVAWFAAVHPEFGWWLTIVAWMPLIALSLALKAGRPQTKN